MVPACELVTYTCPMHANVYFDVMWRKLFVPCDLPFLCKTGASGQTLLVCSSETVPLNTLLTSSYGMVACALQSTVNLKSYIKSLAFTLAKYSEVFCMMSHFSIGCYAVCIFCHSVLIEAETVSVLTWLIAKGDFILFASTPNEHFTVILLRPLASQLWINTEIIPVVNIW